METIARSTLLQPGDLLRCYRIEKLLGQGGFGVTYLATDINLDLLVAIKEYLPSQLATRAADNAVRPTLENDPNFQWGLDRFIKEARTLARFNHPNIVRIMAVFEMNHTAYMVMEFERGQDLSVFFKDDQRHDEVLLKSIIGPIIEGLKEVHRQGFIHRDIKPANILLRDDNTPVLLDFGSARQAMGSRTQALTAMVSVGYAPLEQYNNSDDQQGPWTDIYALGAVLYYGISGNAPIDSTLRGSAVLNNRPDPLPSVLQLAQSHYSRSFLDSVDWALNFRIADRPQNLEEWSEPLLTNERENYPGTTRFVQKSGYRTHQPGATQPGAAPPQPGAVRNRNRHRDDQEHHPSVAQRTTDTPWDLAGIGDSRKTAHRPARTSRRWRWKRVFAGVSLIFATSIVGLMLIAERQTPTIKPTGKLTETDVQNRPVEAANEKQVPAQTQPADSGTGTQQQAVPETTRQPEQQEVKSEAQRPVELAERQRIDRETQRRQAELAKQQSVDRETQRLQADAAEQQRIEREARRQAELAEQQRIEREAKRKAELAEQQRIDSEVKRRAEITEQQRIDSEALRQAELAEQQRTERDTLRKTEAELATPLETATITTPGTDIPSPKKRQRLPITDNDMRFVLRKFNMLKQAIENRDATTLAKLTIPVEQKKKLFSYLFNNFETIEVSLSSFTAKPSDQSIHALLQIQRMVRTNGDIAFPSSGFREIPLHAVREVDGWSPIIW
jgi:serine/threonine protein kinase